MIFFIKLFNLLGYDLFVLFVNDSYYNFFSYWSWCDEDFGVLFFVYLVYVFSILGSFFDCKISDFVVKMLLIGFKSCVDFFLI